MCENKNELSPAQIFYLSENDKYYNEYKSEYSNDINEWANAIKSFMKI